MRSVERWVLVEVAPHLRRGIATFDSEELAREALAARTSSAGRRYEVELGVQFEPDDPEEA